MARTESDDGAEVCEHRDTGRGICAYCGTPMSRDEPYFPGGNIAPAGQPIIAEKTIAMTDPANGKSPFMAIGKAIYGEEWRTQTQELIQVNARTLSRFVKDPSIVPLGVWKTLLLTAQNKSDQLQKAMAPVEAILHAIDRA